MFRCILPLTFSESDRSVTRISRGFAALFDCKAWHSLEDGRKGIDDCHYCYYDYIRSLSRAVAEDEIEGDCGGGKEKGGPWDFLYPAHLFGMSNSLTP